MPFAWNPAATSVRVITPIVFCASFVPCASDTSDDVKIWPTLNPACDGVEFRVMSSASLVATNATTPAITGASSAGSTIFDSSTTGSIAPNPAPTTVAPIRPPNRACDDELGSPSSHVIRFHTIAPTSPAKIICGVIRMPSAPSRISPPLMVFATSVLRNAPTRFSTAAISTATFGLSAPVAIGVAMALAVSWNPFVKSKKRASAMTSATTTVMSTGAKSRTGNGVGQMRLVMRMPRLCAPAEHGRSAPSAAAPAAPAAGEPAA